jgi:hypothetical protein
MTETAHALEDLSARARRENAAGTGRRRLGSDSERGVNTQKEEIRN